jgi:Ala-tRNA(Pro) deacylase
MAELVNVNLPYPEAVAKNLFVRDDKKRKYYVITVKGDKRVDLKEFRKANNTRPLAFASEEDLFSILKLTPGWVTPLGILNDDERRVEFYLDASFLESDSLIGVHPNDNTVTVWLKSKDLISIIKEHGNSVHVVSI